MSIENKLITIAENEPKVYSSGYFNGRSTGYFEGYEDGEDIGYGYGYSDGYDNGYNEGDTSGYENGYTDGEIDGKEIGIEEGKQAQYNLFWDTIQNKGGAVNYNSTFYCWQYDWSLFDKLYVPKYDFIHASNANGTFRECYVKDIFKDNYFNYKTSATELMYTFYYATRLENARTLYVREDTKYTSAFNGCGNLKEIRFEGTIGQNGLNFSSSTKLSYESLMSIIEHLKDYSGTGTTKTVTLGATNLAKLSDTEKAIATEKGWTLA